MQTKIFLPLCLSALLIIVTNSCKKPIVDLTEEIPAAKRLTKMSSIAIGYAPIERFGYDADGKLSSWRYEETGSYIQYSFSRSALGLITQIVQRNNIRPDSIVYTVTSSNGQYTGIDIPAKPGDPTEKIVYACDADDNITTRKLLKDYGGGAGFVLVDQKEYTYQNKNLTSLKYFVTQINGSLTLNDWSEYEYDAKTNPAKCKDEWIFLSELDFFGHLESRTSANNVSIARINRGGSTWESFYTYNNHGQPIGAVSSLANSNNNRITITYTYE